MIPRDYITEWRTEAPWVQDAQVEQDLVVSRALVETFSHPVLADRLAFRGGTALYKLYLKPPARYSEDIDLVQRVVGPVGPIMDALHGVLDPWLGKPRWKQTESGVTFLYRFESEDVSRLLLRLKIEINTREHFSVYGHEKIPFSVASRWFRGTCEIPTYLLDELLATKMRALYQRKKGRDLFDLATGLDSKETDASRTVAAFREYMERTANPVSRAMFERNLAFKAHDPQFNRDIGPLLAKGRQWDIADALDRVGDELVDLLPGTAWRGR